MKDLPISQNLIDNIWQTKTVVPPILKVYRADEILSIKFPETRWLVDELIPYGAVGILSARYGSYKSWLSQYLASQISIGGKAFGEFQCSEANVLIIDLENNHKLIQDRLNTLEHNSSRIYYITDEDIKYDQNSDKVKYIKEFIKENEIAFVCNDSLIRFLGRCNENDSNDMSIITKTIKSLSSIDTTVFSLDHHRKNTIGDSRNYGDSLRGSIEKLGGVDLHFILRVEDKEKRIIKVINEKNRLNPEVPTFTIQFIEDEITGKRIFKFLDYEKKEVTESTLDLTLNLIEVLLNSLEKATKQEIIDFVKDGGGYSSRKIDDVLKDMESREILFSTMEGKNKVYFKEKPTIL